MHRVYPTSDERQDQEQSAPDVETLIAFYVTTKGETWTTSAGWLDEKNLAEWSLAPDFDEGGDDAMCDPAAASTAVCFTLTGSGYASTLIG